MFTYLVPPPLPHRPPHPETDSVGAVFLLYSISAQYHTWLRRKTLTWTTGARNTTHKNTENTGAGLSYSGSGVCPTNLHISAGSSRIKTTELPYFTVTSRIFIFRSQKKCFAFIFNSNCHDDVVITSPQQAST
jgi:hypothetical protein